MDNLFFPKPESLAGKLRLEVEDFKSFLEKYA